MKLLLIVALQAASALARGGTPVWELGDTWTCNVQTQRECKEGESACPLKSNDGVIKINFKTGRLDATPSVFLPTIYVRTREFFGDHWEMGASKIHFSDGVEMLIGPSGLPGIARPSGIFSFILTDTNFSTQRSFAGTCRADADPASGVSDK